MERKSKLILGLIGGLSLFFINLLFAKYFYWGGIFSFIIHKVMVILSFIGLVVVEIISIILIIDMIKFMIKTHKH